MSQIDSWFSPFKMEYVMQETTVPARWFVRKAPLFSPPVFLLFYPLVSHLPFPLHNHQRAQLDSHQPCQAVNQRISQVDNHSLIRVVNQVVNQVTCQPQTLLDFLRHNQACCQVANLLQFPPVLLPQHQQARPLEHQAPTRVPNQVPFHLHSHPANRVHSPVWRQAGGHLPFLLVPHRVPQVGVLAASLRRILLRCHLVSRQDNLPLYRPVVRRRCPQRWARTWFLASLSARLVVRCLLT
jgi:hypothetical protein